MTKTYVYLHHTGFDFYLSDRELGEQERYCSQCDDYDILLGSYNNEDALSDKLGQLFSEGYDLLPCQNYEKILDKYCPLALRAFLKQD